MGMYDSLYVPCPKCGKELEFQSKSGACILWNNTRKDLDVITAIGMDKKVVLCQFCNAHIEFNLLNNIMKARFKLKIVKRKEDYRGNYNPDHPDSIKAQKRLDKILGRKK